MHKLFDLGGEPSEIGGIGVVRVCFREMVSEVSELEWRVFGGGGCHLQKG